MCQMNMERFNGLIAGYDPGGNKHHGYALAEFESGSCKSLMVETLPNAEAVIDRLLSTEALHAIGIDTLAAWGTGPSGWRPADVWLRQTYPEVRLSVVSPNSLYGAMALNGMAVLASVRQIKTQVQIAETHPKVLYWALSRKKYNYSRDAAYMDAKLSDWLGCSVKTRNDHEWDAVISLWAALNGAEGKWSHDLFTETARVSSRLIFPAGQANYWWPE